MDVGSGKRKTTSHGQGVVVNEEVIDVELEDFSLLGEDSFTSLKFFSRSEDDDLCEVDYDTDSQKGISVGSPFSLQLAFSSPLSLDKDLSACMALLKNSPAKASSESLLNFRGDTSVQEQDIKEQLGTSHAQTKEDPDRVLPLEQDGSNSVVIFPAISLSIPAGTE